MNILNFDVDWDIDPEDVNEHDSEYSGYAIKSINVNDDKKEIWSVTYSYSWHCGDYCCSDTKEETAYVGDLSEWIKKRILKKLPDYKFQGA